MSRLTINTNIPAANAQRRLKNATDALSESFSRLSSGLRINKPSDDAAGLAVSANLTIDKRVLSQAGRNINDGISYLNVAEGALDEMGNILMRIQELAEQGSNGTLSTAQRNALQQEVTSLQNEYNRILNSTKFNGNALLTGTTTSTTLQGGYGDGAQLTTIIGEQSLGISTDQTRAGEITRLSESGAGVQGNNTSSNPKISANGRYVVFDSTSTNLTSGDSNGVADVFRKDLYTGEILLVSTSSAGAAGNAASTRGDISSDGRYITFQSDATNLVSGDSNGVRDIFIKDMLTGETRRLSTSTAGTQSTATSSNATISEDGRYVSFESNSTNLVTGDTNGFADIFRKDTVTGETLLVSSTSLGTIGNSLSGEASISMDGRYIAFQSNSSNLVTGDTNGQQDLFRKDMVTGEILRVNTSTSGTQANNLSYAPIMSADGRYVAFTSIANSLVSGDSNSAYDIFRKDMTTGTTIRVNTDSNGNQVTGSNVSPSMASGISADGRFILFTSSATNLVSGDTNAAWDIFRKDTVTGEVLRIGVSNSGVEGSGGGASSTIQAMSADGRYVAFESTFTNLVNGDSNAVADIFLRDLAETGIQEISELVVSNQLAATVTLDIVRRYQEELSLHKANIGASINRASIFYNTLQTLAENYAAASSQITDMDVAEEASKLTANNILQSSASVVLSNANQQPSLILKLLKSS